MSDAKGDLVAKQRKFIGDLFTHLLDRPARSPELEHWTNVLTSGRPEREVFELFLNGKEFRERHKVVPGFPSGHFYSPVVDPNEVKEYWTKSSAVTVGDLAGLHLDIDSMKDFWFSNEDCIRAAPFTPEPGGHSRYYYGDGRYPKGDAIILMSMINTFRPKHVIEIGSGFSTAAMLDTADLLDLRDLRLTCIDPYASRLRSLMRSEDHQRVTIHEKTVQSVTENMFADLDSNDILFIDSSHVLKTGSDVHFELFSILPTLKSGVLIHFHDIQFPFEYPKEWVFKNRWSWNEIYAVRAFLMYNDQFKIEFFTDYFIRSCPEVIRAIFPDSKSFIGGSLWLRRL